MRYVISKRVMDFTGFIEINEAEYLLIKTARQNLFEMLFLEEQLDLVTENYYEYETELLAMASRMMIFSSDDQLSMSRERNLIGRRIVNLLTAGRMYVHQSVQHVERMYGANSSTLGIINKEFNLQYENSLGYRAMEALRNYVQHRGVPIQSIKFSYKVVDPEMKSQLLYRAIPLIGVLELAEDQAFKRSILDELKKIQHDGRVDARPLVREYMEGISSIHEKIRELVDPDLVRWETVLDGTIEKFQAKFGKETSLAGLIIASEGSDGQRSEMTISNVSIERRQALEKKNRALTNLHKSYASNEIINDDAYR